MKTQTVIIALTAMLFAIVAFADHNERDELGRKHGHWTEEFADGIVEEGTFVNGIQTGHWVYRYPKGDVQEGPIVGGKRNGHWVLRNADGGVQEGPFV